MPFAPPTLWQGRLLVGGGDGRICCLAATTGRCLWQFQAAPAERRIFWFGHLISTWPIVGGVVVQDGVAYAVAGLAKENGIHAYALDAKSGKVIWEKDDAGAGGQAGPGGGLASIGQVAAGAGKLWLCSSSSVPGSFDLKSGQWQPAAGGVYGCEIGVIDGKWTVHGGRRLTETQDTLTKPLSGTGLAGCSVDGQPAGIPVTDAGTSLPAWDQELAIMPPKAAWGALTALPLAKLMDWFPQRAAQLASKPPASGPKPKPSEWAEHKLWATETIVPVAFALAKDQLVVAYLAEKRAKLSGFSRTDGAKAWTIDLPEQPVMNRLAIDRDGRTIVALCDGSVVCVGR